MMATIDTSVLNQRLAQLQTALQANGVDVVRSESGQLAWEIANQLGPRTKAESGKRLDKDLKRSFYVTSGKTNLSATQQFSKYPAFTWLYASKYALVGFEDKFDARDDAVDELLKRHYAKAGGKWKELGNRGWSKAGMGGQKIMQVRKPVILKKQRDALHRIIMAKVGQARASFARTAAELIPSKRIPAWVRAQIATVTGNGKSIFQPAGLSDRFAPHLSFGSHAKGVESNHRMNEKIHRAIVRRGQIVAAKVKKVLAGYAYDWNTGAVFRRPTMENN